MALREILAKFGVEFDTKELKEGHKEVEHAKEGLEGFKKAIEALVGVAFVEGIKSFVEGIAKTGAELHALSTQTGLSTENIQLFDYAAGQAGVSAEEMHASVTKLSLSLAEAAHGSSSAAKSADKYSASATKFSNAASGSAGGVAEQAKAFAELGVAARGADGMTRDINEVLPELVAGFGNLKDPGQRARLAVELFGRAGVRMVGFLSQGKEGLEKFKEEFEDLGGGMTEEAIEAADKYDSSLGKLKLSFTSIKGEIAAELFPVLTKLTTGIAKGIGQFREFAKSTELVKGFLAAMGVVGVAALVALLAPFAPLIAAISTVTLFFDDLFNFIEGNDSVIGAALNAMFGPEVTEKVRGGLKDIDKEVKVFFDDLLEHPKRFIEDLKLLFKGLPTAVQKLFGLTPSLQEQGVSVPDSQKAASAQEWNNTPETFGSKQITKMVQGDWLINKLFGQDTVQGWFKDQQRWGYQDDPKVKEFYQKQADASKDEENSRWGHLDTPEVKKFYSDQADQAPSAADDKFSRFADAFANFVGMSPSTGTIAPMTAAIPGNAQTVTKTVEQNNTNHFHLEAGTPEETKSSVEEGVTKGLGNERRNAQLSLENTGGA